MVAKTQNPAHTPPGSPSATHASRLIHGVDTHTADGVVLPTTTIHANLTSTSRSPRRHTVVQSGVIPHTTREQVRSVFLDLRNMWKWHFDVQRIEALNEGDGDLDSFFPAPLHYQQRVYFYPKNKDKQDGGATPSDEPIVQKVVAVAPYAVSFRVDSRPPLRTVHVIMSVETMTTTNDDVKASSPNVFGQLAGTVPHFIFILAFSCILYTR